MMPELTNPRSDICQDCGRVIRPGEDFSCGRCGEFSDKRLRERLERIAMHPDAHPDDVHLPPGPFGVIYADPPWQFKTWSDKGRNRCPDAMVRQKGLAERHYAVMNLDDIAALPVADVAARDCVLFLWAVDCMIDRAIEIGEGWGFKFKTVGFYWVKTGKHDPSSHPIGMGYWTRGNPEQCLMFTRGKPKKLSSSVRKLIHAPRREHSRKPDEARQRIEQLVAGPYLEMFARSSVSGWTVWGNQTERFDDAA